MHIHIPGDETKDLLWPFTALRAAADLRMGIFTPRERYSRLAHLMTAGANGAYTIGIPGNVVVSFKGLEHLFTGAKPSAEDQRVLLHASDLFKYNDWAIRQDMEWIRSQAASAPIPTSVTAINPGNIFIAPGAKLQHCMLNAEQGPIYIGEDAEIMEGSFLRGPVAVCNNALVKMGAKIYGATTIGPYCLSGGEIKNSVMMGFSNKAHDGYLGDAVLGEWCNLGAGTSNSNLKNTAGEIKIMSGNGEPYNAGIKCGLIMGDHSRSAINTSFNTGTVVGVCCNVFGAGLTPNYIPHFSWGLSGDTYREEEAVRDAKNWMALKGKSMNGEAEAALRAFYHQTKTNNQSSS